MVCLAGHVEAAQVERAQNLEFFEMEDDDDAFLYGSDEPVIASNPSQRASYKLDELDVLTR